MEEKAKWNPWIFTAAAGIIAIVFAVFGLQQQTKAMEMNANVERMKAQVEIANNRALEYERTAAQSMQLSQQREREYVQQLQDCLKGKKR